MNSKYIILFSIGSIWALLIIFLFLQSIPSNPLSMYIPENGKINKVLLPQGWAFFTRNPREDRVMFYTYENDEWSDLYFLKQNSKHSNLFGLNRKARAQQIELGLLISNTLKSSSWRDTTAGTNINNILPLKEPLIVVNESINPTICGETLLIKEEVIPWAWSKDKDSILPPFKFIHIFSKCN